MESFLTAQQQLAMQLSQKDLDAQRLAAEERRLHLEAAMKKEEIAERKEQMAERDRQRAHEERKLAMAAEQQRLQQREEDRKSQYKLMADWQKASADERVRQQTLLLSRRTGNAGR